MVTFNINHIYGASKSYIWFPSLSSVTIGTNLSGDIGDFLKLLFHLFPYNEI